MKKLLLATLVAVSASAAQATPIVYHGMNPQISPSAYPSNEGAINDMASLTKPKNTGPHTTSGQLTEAQLIKQSTINGLSSRYTALLTGSSPDNGTVNFGDGSYADYRTTGGIRYITFHNNDGSSTEISFPI